MWIWTAAAVTDATARTKLFAFTAQHHVTRIYMEAGAGSNVLTGNLMAKHPAELATFLNEAKAQCVDVDLLFGDATWTVTSGHSIPLGLAQQAVSFANGLAGTKPAGVHFDIEPHGVHGVSSGGVSYDWDTLSQRTAILSQLLDLSDGLQSTVSGSGLELSMDIPFWLGSDFMVSHGGVSKPTNQHLIDIIGRAVIMDYRDSAFGTGSNAASSSDGMYDGAADEVAYAHAHNKPITLGAETGGCLSTGGSLQLTGELEDKITFCNEGKTVMESELNKLRAAYTASGANVNLAVHHYGSYSDPTQIAP